MMLDDKCASLYKCNALDANIQCKINGVIVINVQER
jgi:hypothetical protein